VEVGRAKDFSAPLYTYHTVINPFTTAVGTTQSVQWLGYGLGNRGTVLRFSAEARISYFLEIAHTGWPPI